MSPENAKAASGKKRPAKKTKLTQDLYFHEGGVKRFARKLRMLGAGQKFSNSVHAACFWSQ